MWWRYLFSFSHKMLFYHLKSFLLVKIRCIGVQHMWNMIRDAHVLSSIQGKKLTLIFGDLCEILCCGCSFMWECFMQKSALIPVIFFFGSLWKIKTVIHWSQGQLSPGKNAALWGWILRPSQHKVHMQRFGIHIRTSYVRYRATHQSLLISKEISIFLFFSTGIQ